MVLLTIKPSFDETKITAELFSCDCETLPGGVFPLDYHPAILTSLHMLEIWCKVPSVYPRSGRYQARLAETVYRWLREA